MDFIKVIGSTAQSSIYPINNLISADLSAALKVRLRFKAIFPATVATATCTIGGGSSATARVIQTTTIANKGGVYNSTPTAALSYGNGALLPVIVNGIVTGLTITTAGTDYTDAAGAPTITISTPSFSNDAYDEVIVTTNTPEQAVDLLGKLTQPGVVNLQAGTNGIYAVDNVSKGIMLGPNQI
tara:strand:- start:42 stop:593 length:552 start_codon:yes stop_codon:yes gene_type:complete